MQATTAQNPVYPHMGPENHTQRPFNLSSTASTTTNLKLRLTVSRYVAVATTAVSFYITFALAMYTWKKRRRRGIPKVNYLPFLASIICLTQNLAGLLETWVVGLNCKAYVIASCVFYGAEAAVVYTLFWARQRRLYNDKLLAHRVGKCLKVLSSSIIIVIYIFIAGVCIAIIGVTDHANTLSPCHSVWNKENIKSQLLITVIYIPVCLGFQLILFFLVVSPLLHKKRCKANCCFRVSLKRDKEIHRLVMRLAVCTTACGIFSVLLPTIVILDNNEVIVAPEVNIIAINSIVCILAMMCTFADWRLRIFPFLFRNHKGGSSTFNQPLNTTSASVGISSMNNCAIPA
ncbi:unnamed protein product [Clavelina lepadiformis]|uniref:G-protein coupled receptors family 1 profile domain-containing protein n=1 Tax=Clavelina lepadiformis TaxID=159417 RepID=A0ABP0GM89_CLALP